MACHATGVSCGFVPGDDMAAAVGVRRGGAAGALAAPRQLFEDRHRGLPELLLVTPLPERELVKAAQTAIARSLRSLFGAALLMNVLLRLCLLGGKKETSERVLIFTVGGFC
jgi:hypothetical protein